MIRIKAYTESDIEAVKAFNVRMKAGNSHYVFPEHPIPEQFPRLPGRTLYREYYLACDDAQVRGGYILQTQAFWIDGQALSIGFLFLPLSEGIIDPAYRVVGVQILKDALERQPNLFLLGMGSRQESVVKLVQALKFNVYDIPFHFRVVHPSNFARHIQILRTSPLRRTVLDMAAVTRAAWLPVKLLHRVRTTVTRRAKAEPVSQFDGWADDLWEQHKHHYFFAAARTSDILNLQYPPGDPRFTRLKVIQDGEVIGWALVLHTRHTDHRQFGNMHLGSIVDCMSAPDDAPQVMACATAFLEQQQVDLIISNQCHAMWTSALEMNGFLQGPSNFILALSPGFAPPIVPFSEKVSQIHMNRGDGEGPIHL